MFCCRIRRVSVSFPTQVRFSLSPDVRFLPGCSGRRILSCVRPSRADPAPALVGNYRAGTRSAAGVEAEYERQAVVLVTVSAGCDPARREGSRAPPSALRKPALYNWDEPARTTVGESRRDPGGPRRNRCVQLLGGSESGSDGGTPGPVLRPLHRPLRLVLWLRPGVRRRTPPVVLEPLVQVRLTIKCTSPVLEIRRPLARHAIPLKRARTEPDVQRGLLGGHQIIAFRHAGSPPCSVGYRVIAEVRRGGETHRIRWATASTATRRVEGHDRRAPSCPGRRRTHTSADPALCGNRALKLRLTKFLGHCAVRTIAAVPEAERRCRDFVQLDTGLHLRTASRITGVIVPITDTTWCWQSPGHIPADRAMHCVRTTADEDASRCLGR